MSTLSRPSTPSWPHTADGWKIYFYLSLRGRNQDIVMALSAKDGMPVGWISINPWG
jgi:hypothetical protein